MTKGAGSVRVAVVGAGFAADFHLASYQRVYGVDLEVVGIVSRTRRRAADLAKRYGVSKVYPDFAAVAKQEGFKDIATSFEEIAEVEEQHELRYRKLLANVKNGQVFKRDKAVKWHCRNCGYVHEGPEAPEECPACKHPQAYYELWCEAY